jgi:RNA polymerase sigma factor (sigma-70 family)
MRERDLLATAGAHLDDAWADWNAQELRVALDGIDDPTIRRLDRGRMVSLTPPRDLDDVFDRTLLVEQAAGLVAEAELPQSQARGWQSVPGLFDEPLLTAEDERRLGLGVRRGDRGAMNRLVSSNTRLCITHIRKPAARPGLDEEDQLQEAFLGLIRAAEKFEIDRGFKFSTYATWWIRQTISRAIADKALTIRLPVHVLDRMNKVRTARLELRREFKREPTDAEIRAATDIDPSDLVYPTRMSRPLEPLDARADAISRLRNPGSGCARQLRAR